MSNFRTTAREIREVQNFKEFYSRLFSGKISPYLAAACVPTSITPNHLTLAMIPSGIIGGLIAMNGTYLSFFIGGLFFVLLNVLDAADGELARHSGKTSDFGDYLDRVAHYATNSAAALGVGVGLYFLTGQMSVLYVMVALEISLLLDEAVRDLLMACGLDRKNEESESRKQVKLRSRLHVPSGLRAVGSLAFSNVAFFHILPLAAVIGWGLGDARVLLWYYELFALASVLKVILRVRGIFRGYS